MDGYFLILKILDAKIKLKIKMKNALLYFPLEIFNNV